MDHAESSPETKDRLDLRKQEVVFVGSRANNKSRFFPIIAPLCVLLCMAGAWAYLATLGAISRGWPLLAFVTFVMGVALIWRHRWVYWLCSGSSLFSVMAAFMATESQFSWVTLSFLYLFVTA